MRDSRSCVGAVSAVPSEATVIAGKLLDAADGLRARLGSRYDWFLAQGKTAIVMTMAALDISSPFLAAVHLGVHGELTSVVGSEDDAFAVLIQAALQIWSDRSGSEVN